MTTGIRDADLRALPGTTIDSQSAEGTSYRIELVLGEGAHGVVYLAERRDGGEPTRVVIKLLRPRAIRHAAALVASTIVKEVEALKRLGARTPPPENVVRFLDAGTLSIGDPPLALPWVAIEHVHGGPEGVTLRARVEGALARTGRAFDPERASNAVRCMAAGITAVHEVGVIHRDVTPSNVLACDGNAREIYKLADFGLARVSSASTFGDVLLGTPGYCAPEQSFPGKIGIGPFTDVFGFACTTYFALAGEPYFAAPTIPETLVLVHAPARRSLLEARALSPALGADPERCRALDGVLAAATQAHPRDRPQTAAEFGQAILRVLA